MNKLDLLKRIGFVLILIVSIAISNFDIFNELYYIIGRISVVIAITLMLWTFILYKIEE